MMSINLLNLLHISLWQYREELKQENLSYCHLVFKNIVPSVFRCNSSVLFFLLKLRNDTECQVVYFLLEKTLKAQKKGKNLMARNL